MRVGVDVSSGAFNRAGNARYSYSLLQALQAQAGQEEIVLIPLALPAAWRAPAPGLRRKALSLLWETLYARWFLPWLARRHRLDLLHLTAPLPIGRVPCPVVTTIHDVIPLLFPDWFPPLMRARLQRWLRQATEQATHLLASSHATTQDLIRLGLATPDTVSTVHLASFLDVCPPPAPSPAAAHILTVGTLEPRKNLATVLDAYRLLAERHPVAPPLCVVGATGWMASDTQARAQRLGIGARVQLAGYVSDATLRELYAGAAMLVYPSLYEGFGMPPLEAMSCGCPVVASNVSSLPEVVGEAGLLVPPTDVEALAGAMHGLLTEPAQVAHLRTLGYQQAARFSWARCARETVAVYRTVVQRHAAWPSIQASA